MILFLNVFITDNRVKYHRGHYGDSYDRITVFKYTLASYSVIEWSHVIIYYGLDVSYQSRREEIKSWINYLFKNHLINFHLLLLFQNKFLKIDYFLINILYLLFLFHLKLFIN